MSHITENQFTTRFVSLNFGGGGFPKKLIDRHILLISSILRLDSKRKYTESELNDELSKWTSRFGAHFGLDHVTLRRFLVDDGYIKRDTAGLSYELSTKDLPHTFDQSIEHIDLRELIDEAKREREKRKQQYIKDSKQ